MLKDSFQVLEYFYLLEIISNYAGSPLGRDYCLSTMAPIMKNIDIVVHFAAESHVDRSIKDPAIFVKTNVLGTQILLDNQIKKELLSYSNLYKKSISQIIRESLAVFFAKKKKKQIGIGGLEKISKMGFTGGPKNLSEIIDDVLY